MEKECEAGCPAEVGHPLRATELLQPPACKPELGTFWPPLGLRLCP